MHARRIRVEFIRFSLLITLTIALVSVAIRHSDGHRHVLQAGRSGTPTTSSSPGTTASSSSGQQAGAGSSAGSSTGSGGSTGTSSSSAGTGGGSTSSGGQSVATLPRTGGTQIAELGGLAALLIAAGSFSVTVSRRTVR